MCRKTIHESVVDWSCKLIIGCLLVGSSAYGQYASVGDEYGDAWVDSFWWNGFFNRSYTQDQYRYQMVQECRARLQQSAMPYYKQSSVSGAAVQTQEQLLSQPPAPTKLSAKVSDKTVALSWGKSYLGGVTAQAYRVQVSKYATFSSFVLDEEVVEETYSFVGKTNVTYYWRVAARFDQQGAFSQVSSVRVTVDTDPPVLLQASLKTTIISNNVTVFWQAADDTSGVSGYILQIADSSSFSNVVIGGWVVAENSVTNSYSTSVLGPGTYAWRLAAVDVKDQISAFATGVNFSVSASVKDHTPPTLSADAVQVCGGDSFLFFSWGAAQDASGIANYQLQVFSASSCVLDSRVIDVYTKGPQYTAIEQLPGTYYYRMRVQDTEGNWSAWSQVHVYENVVPRVSGMASVMTGIRDLRLCWDKLQSVTGATYHVDVFADNLLSNRLVSLDVRTNIVTVCDVPVFSDRICYWRVRASDPKTNLSGEWAEASAVFPITTGAVAASVANQQLATSLALSENALVVGNMDSTRIYQVEATSNRYTLAWTTATTGSSADASGDWFIVGHPDTKYLTLTNAGSAFIARLDGTTKTNIFSSSAEPSGAFGWDVAVGSDWALVGAPDEDKQGVDSGCVYCLKRNGLKWEQSGCLQAPLSEHAWFGQAVAMDGDWACVGAGGCSNAYANVGLGACYFYKLENGEWLPFQWIEAPLTAVGFGWDVDIDGEWTIIGASQTTFSESGIAYLYHWDGMQWSHFQTLRSECVSDQESGFGQQVRVKGRWAVVSPLHDSTKASNAGAVYVYYFNGQSWVSANKLVDPNGSAEASWGYATALSGTGKLIVGAPGDSTGAPSAGAMSFITVPDLMGKTLEVPASANVVVTVSTNRQASLCWSNAVSLAACIKYEVQVDNYRLFDSPEFATLTQVPYATTPVLSPGYYAYRVRVKQTNEQWSVWSDTAFFEVIDKPTATVRVTFNVAGGSVASPATKDVTIGGTYGALAVTTRSGYTFDGWWTATNGVRNQVISSSRVDCLSNHVLYAVWHLGSGWGQVAKLTAGDGAQGDNMGASCAISGDTIVAGANFKYSKQGAAYVFVRNEGGWEQQAKLKASNGAVYDRFGTSVSIAGDTIIVGAPYDDTYAGSAYLFDRQSNIWSQRFSMSPSLELDRFGMSVSIDNNHFIIGSPFDDDQASDAGSAYPYRLDGSILSRESTFFANDGVPKDQFGNGVSIWGNTAIVGTCATNAGAVYVYTNGVSGWKLQAKLVAKDGAVKDMFGSAVAIHSNTVIVGACFDDDKGTDSGSCYIFTRQGTNWTQQAKIAASDGAAGDGFGANVAIYADTVVVGANGDDDAGASSGSAYVFSRQGTTWSQKAKLIANDAVAGIGFGSSVTLSSNTIVVGSPGDSARGVGAGAIYVFGTPQKIVIKGNGIAISDGDNFPRTADNTNFGSDGFPGLGISRTFNIFNTGGSSLHLTGKPRIRISGAHFSDFAVASQPAPIVVPGAYTSFTIRFMPTAVGLCTATVSVANDDLDEDPYDFVVCGTGTANTYRVTFNPSGGNVGQTNKIVTYGQTYGTLPLATRANYRFTGWWIDTNMAGTEIISGSIVTVATDHTLYAKWVATATVTTQVSVPYTWLDQFGLVVGGNYEAAALADIDGDGLLTWQEYLAGTVPTNRESVFRTSIMLSNGVPFVTWTPDLGTERVYTVEGKASLTNEAWLSPTNAATRFFRVKVAPKN